MNHTSRPEHTEPTTAATDETHGPSGPKRPVGDRGSLTIWRRYWPGWRYASFLATLFVLLVGAAATGALLLSSSNAKAAEISGTWESGGFAPFSALECPHTSTQFQLVTSPVREGSHAAKFNITANDVWSNGSVRCLAAMYDSGETTGMDKYFHLSVYFPGSGITDNLIWELHHPSSLYDLAGCGIAPFALTTKGSALNFRLATGDCKVGDRSSYWEPNIAIPGLNPFPTNTWIDLVIHIRFSESSNGLVEVWNRSGGRSWPSSPQLTRNNIPTMPFSSTTGVHNVKLYTEMGLYPGYSGYSSNDTIYLDDYRRESSLAAALGGSAAAPAPAPAPTPAPAPAPTPAPAPAPTPTPAPTPAQVQTPTTSGGSTTPATPTNPTRTSEAPPASGGSAAAAPTLIPAPEPGTVATLELQPYVIEWSDRLFRDVGDFRSYLIGLGVDWSAFLERHPAVVAQGGLLAVAWDGAQFYDQESLTRRLRTQGISYRRWARNHPTASAILSGRPVTTAQRAIAKVREKRVAITWSGIAFTSANGLRMHLAHEGTDWNTFLVANPAAAQRLGLASVGWNGQRFYTRAALARWLVNHRTSLAKWDLAHPGFASKLVP